MRYAVPEALKYVWFHAGCTGVFQPADVCLQRPFKAGFFAAFNQHLCSVIQEKIASMSADMAINTKLSVPQPKVPGVCLAGRERCVQLQRESQIISKGWEDTGLLEAIIGCTCREIKYGVERSKSQLFFKCILKRSGCNHKKFSQSGATRVYVSLIISTTSSNRGIVFNADFQTEALDLHAMDQLFPTGQQQTDDAEGSEAEPESEHDADAEQENDAVTDEADALLQIQLSHDAAHDASVIRAGYA